MRLILHYFGQMLPALIKLLPIYVLLRAAVLHAKKSSPRLLHELALLLLTCAMLGIFSQAVLSELAIGNGTLVVRASGGRDGFNFVPLRIFAETCREVQRGNMAYLTISFLGNILLFVPVGLLCSLAFPGATPRRAALWGLTLSLAIELCQIPLPRYTDVDDLLFNTLGAWLGYLLFRCLTRRFPELPEHFWPRRAPD